jgi:putative tricarboxylic transport membrane protein
MRVYDIPLVPAVMGLVLGPLAEQQFRRTLAISQGDMSVLVTRPACALLLFSSVAVLFGSRLLRSKEASGTSPHDGPVRGD